MHPCSLRTLRIAPQVLVLQLVIKVNGGMEVVNPVVDVHTPHGPVLVGIGNVLVQ